LTISHPSRGVQITIQHIDMKQGIIQNSLEIVRAMPYAINNQNS